MGNRRAAESPAPLRMGPVDVLLLAIAFGVGAGLAESVVHLVRQRVLQRTLFMSPEYWWQVPLADALIFLVFGVLYVLLSLVLPRLRAPRVVTSVFGVLAALAVLLLYERIHIAAEVVLALAIGVALGRALHAKAGSSRALRLGVPLVLVVLIAAGAVQRAIRGSRERSAVAALPAAGTGRPNILLLVLDTVRAWNLGLYGYGRATTPWLRNWAAKGVVFDRVLAPAPWTTLSHAVMFTGRHPTELSVGWDRPLDRTFPTLAQVLSDAGYATGGFVANYTQAGRPTGLARGFAHYEDYPLEAVAILRRTGLLRRLSAVDAVARLVGRRRMIEGRVGHAVNEAFLDWVASARGRPWFAFLNYYDAHGPYLPPAPFDTLFFARPAPVAQRYWDLLVRAYGAPPVPVEDLGISLDAYDGGITYLDTQVDALLKALEDAGQLSNTIVVVTSDHGELFGEHGVISHGNNLYLQVLHVPLVLVAPGRAPEGVRVESLASLRDLPATLLELARVPNPGLPGHSLVGAWAPGPVRPDTLFATVEFNRLLPRFPPAPVLRGSMRSLVLDSLHYILNGDGIEEMYHLGRDSWEVRNLITAPEYRGEVDRHRAAMRSLPQGKGFVPVP